MITRILSITLFSHWLDEDVTVWIVVLDFWLVDFKDVELVYPKDSKVPTEELPL